MLNFSPLYCVILDNYLDQSNWIPVHPRSGEVQGIWFPRPSPMQQQLRSIFWHAAPTGPGVGFGGEGFEPPSSCVFFFESGSAWLPLCSVVHSLSTTHRTISSAKKEAHRFIDDGAF